MATATVLAGVLLSGCRQVADFEASEEHPAEAVSVPDFSDEVLAVLGRRLQLIEQLVAEPSVINAVRDANRESESLSERAIEELDKRWQASDGADDLAAAVISHECAQRLVDFQEAHDGFPEIFVTDARGLVVAATNRTSDYLQSDEDWWKATYEHGRGRSRFGEIEYDESAYSESIPLYVPVVDPGTHEAIGVLKAVCDITAIKMEL
jgi:hypothetical protein